jgi:hypothetical protein
MILLSEEVEIGTSHVWSRSFVNSAVAVKPDRSPVFMGVGMGAVNAAMVPRFGQVGLGSVYAAALADAIQVLMDVQEDAWRGSHGAGAETTGKWSRFCSRGLR